MTVIIVHFPPGSFPSFRGEVVNSFPFYFFSMGQDIRIAQLPKYIFALNFPAFYHLILFHIKVSWNSITFDRYLLITYSV